MLTVSALAPPQVLGMLSLSRPSQDSLEGCVFWLQAIEPAEHAVVPALQTPCLPVLQSRPPPGLPSSTTPLQLLSRPSHASRVGWRVWLHATAPAEQTV